MLDPFGPKISNFWGKMIHENREHQSGCCVKSSVVVAVAVKGIFFIIFVWVIKCQDGMTKESPKAAVPLCSYISY
jgi:hypothetical protein